VAEKPSVARDIAAALSIRGGGRGSIGSGDVRITWCVGHLVELEEPAAYDPRWRSWRLEHLPMLPEEFRLRPRKGARDQWDVVRKLLRDRDLAEVVNACDAGREGELIFAYIYQLAGCRAPVERLWISSMTREAIRQGYERLRPGRDMRRLENAARCRAEADWLVGLNATRAMTLRLRTRSSSTLFSLGRVQTPTLALIDQRERAIEVFVPEPFWQVKVVFARGAADGGPSREEGDRWEGTWTAARPEGATDRISDEPTARAVMERIAGQDGVVARVERKEKRERPPLLYDLTTLQREANKRFRFSAQKTLDLAQSLYEKHKVLTYPRTDSRHIGSDQVPGLPRVIEGLCFPPFEEAARSVLERWPVKPGKRVVDDAEVSDHHAIIPTDTDPRACALSADEKRIFELVARRFLAVFMPDAVFATALIETRIGDDVFLARGRTMLAPGWRAIDPPKSARDDAGQDEAALPPVEEGETAHQVEPTLHQGVTKPPKRFTEATLLAAMERAGEELGEEDLKRAMKRNGLGTPATRAAVIETLISRGYLARESGSLVPTPLGRGLLRALPVEALRSPRMTGEWEARLAAMADGEGTRETFMADIRRFTADLVARIVRAEPMPVVHEPAAPPVRAAPVPPGAYPPAFGHRVDCPICASADPPELGYVIAGRGAWGCSRWKQGCPLRVPFVLHGVRLPDGEAERLFKTGATKVLDEPIGPPESRDTCRVVLAPGQDPGWRLEPKKRARRSRTGR
jgi:DNA topoisomerase-3